jgi:tartrate dehydrogenase/decarboxylase/D-malate dehydrogenase
MTRAGVERIMRFAFKLAQSRPRKLLTVITKSNAQRHAMVMWDEIALQISKEFPDVTWDKELVDARPPAWSTAGHAGHHRRHQPACRHPERPGRRAGRQPGHRPHRQHRPRAPLPVSMFEPIHGSAFDIMGKGLANPVGTFWSVVMLLEHLGEADAAQQVMNAIEQVTANPGCTLAIWAARPRPPRSHRQSANC